MKEGDIAENFKCELVTGTEFDLYSTLANGPVVLNFIMGTWCPFCTNHLKKIRDWQKNIGKNTSMLVISGQSKDSLRSWLTDNPMSYLFASDSNLEIIRLFKAKNLFIGAATPTTILIDSNKQVKMIFKGIRTKTSREKVLNNICELGTC